MIYVYGTSHVSQESLELIDEKIDEHDPDIVALELDFTRLNALLSDNKERNSKGPIFARLIQWFQDSVGKKTGVMPGQEMIYAYRRALEDGRDIGLIDQDIRVTLNKFKGIRRKEKVRAAFQLAAGFIIPGTFDISKIPESGFIDQLLEEMQDQFPGLYRVLVKERNLYMIESLKQLQRNNPNSDIVAFVGAAHEKAIREGLEDEIDSQD